MKYVIIRKLKNGGLENIKTVCNRADACIFCTSLNRNYERLGSPNRVYYEEVVD